MPVTDPKFNPSGNETVATIKTQVYQLEEFMRNNIDPGRRLDVALIQLENFSMWAVKAAVVGDN